MLELFGKGPTLEQLHYDVESSVAQASRKEHAHQVRVVERNGEPGLPLESKDRLLVAGKLGLQDLDGDVTADRGLMGPVDGAHAASADLLIDAKLLEQDATEQGIDDLIVRNEPAAVVRTVL